MYLKNKDLLTELLDDGSAILFDQKTEKTFILNCIGYCIFENIEENTIDSISVIIHHCINNKHEYSIDEIYTYIDKYIKILLDSGLVVQCT